jgi:transmembrane sensor
MTQATDTSKGRLDDGAMAAADWVARLSGEPAEADWLAFEAWLCGAPERRGAYDRALSLWLELDAKAEPLSLAVDKAVLDAERPMRGGAKVKSNGRALGWGVSMMAIGVLAMTVATALRPERPTAPDVYATAKGERRDLVLSDGTHVALNTGSRISVSMRRHAREIVLAQGEAAFQVVHDPRRPFTVQVGDRVLRDIGTDFDVQRREGMVAVTVREGMVAVLRADGDPRSLSLSPGSRWEHREGAPDSKVLVADTEQAFSWRSGRLIYRDRPLSDVAADLGRYGQDEVALAGRAGDLRFSGVLTIDNQGAMIQRLTDLMPLAAARKDGVITLSELNTDR